MKPFLQQVAETYIAHEYSGMMDFCFVFPNKRSGVFFRNYLVELTAGRPFILPKILTIGEFTASLSPLAEASRLDRLFLLYNEYSKLSDDIADFDKFLFWGEMILSDFDDVDLNLADASKLFVNLKRYREVSSYYLTPEQEEILARYWGGQFPHHTPDEFWAHLKDEENTGAEQKFLKLWEVLGPLYDNYHAVLRKAGLGSRGMIARDAVNNLAKADKDSLPFRRYIFVGFNVLSLAEIKIFDILRDRGLADYYWDIAPGAMVADGNRAARFMKRNINCFPSRHHLDDERSSESYPDILVTGVPSGVGQAKDAGRLLKSWVEDGVIKDPGNAIDTAIVLPDETLFVPMTFSVPDEITAFNVTMGFPMRATSFASFISLVVSLQLRAQRARDEWYFFHEDVKALVSHPLLRKIDTDGCDAILMEIRDRRLFLVPERQLREDQPLLSPFFTAINDSDSIEEVYGYFHRLLSTLLGLLIPDEDNDTATDGEDVPDNGEVSSDNMEAYFVRTYLDALDELKCAIDRRGVRMKEITFIQLLQKAIASVSVSFTGEPLKGLQMMGVLETRALDFKNLIILSMNERVFPRKLYSRSFIPDNLRRSYGLPTSDFQESIFSYSFYRLISRAANVRIYYDARNVSGRNSEMSRYISQLLYLFPGSNVRHELLSYSLTSTADEAIVIRKNPDIMSKLREFTPEGGKRTLSASSINDYINCPLSFYLKRLCRLDLEDEVIDYMDSGTYGSILHASVERLYNDFLQGADEVKVTAEMLDSVIKSASRLDKVITFAVNEHFNRLGPDCERPLTGEAMVLGVIMKHFITLLLTEEKKFTPFDFIAAEYEVIRTMDIAPGLSINIRQYIDRIDRVYPEGHYGEDSLARLRIVDYKTGSDNIDFNEFDQLFSNLETNRRKAIVQLMFYCNAYAAHSRYSGPITPVIYQMKTLSTQGLRPITFRKAPVDDYREINDEFLERFTKIVSELFDPDVPFVQAPDDHNCKFCSLTAICRR